MSDTLSDKLVMHMSLSGDSGGTADPAGAVVNHNVVIGESYASFNGKDAYLEIDHREELQFGNEDFSLAVQVWTEQELDDVVGDILSQFDPVKRRGFNLSVKHNAGAVTSQTNFRNLHFEVDNACNPKWHDYGQVGNAVAVWALAVHEGRLYAGTYEQGADEFGRVFRYVGDEQWKCCGTLDGSNTVSALAVFQGSLYAATRTEDPHGSLLEPTANLRPGGNIYRLNSDDTWTHCGKVCDEDNIFGMTVFRGKLYAWPARAKGIYCYKGGTQWQRIDSPDSRLFALAPYHGNLYASANRLGLLDPNVTHAGPHGDPSVQTVVGRDGAYCLNDDGGWSGCGYQQEETQVYSIGIHAGRLFVGTWPSGKVFRYEGERIWHDCGRLGNEDEVMGLAVYNGMLYAGTLPSAFLYRYDSDHNWVSVGQADGTPDVPLRRAINMVVYQGQLCVGTLPSGHVRALEVGQVASHDWSLSHGWHSVAAVRRRGVLHLYLDGEYVAQSASTPEPLILDTEMPLLVGFGRHDYFNGRMRELCIYRRALSDREIVELTKLKPLSRNAVHV